MELITRELAAGISILTGVFGLAGDTIQPPQPTEILRNVDTGYTLNEQVFTIGAMEVYIHNGPPGKPYFLAKQTTPTTIHTVRQAGKILEDATKGTDKFKVQAPLPSAEITVGLDDDFDQCIFGSPSVNSVTEAVRKALPERIKQPDIIALHLHGASICRAAGYASIESRSLLYDTRLIRKDNHAYLVAHEISHVLGGAHELAVSTDTPNVYSQEATAEGHPTPDGSSLLGTRIPYDVTNSISPDLFTGHNLLQLGVLRPDEVATITNPGQYIVRLNDLYNNHPHNSDAFRLLRIPLASPDSTWGANPNDEPYFKQPSYLYVEMRTYTPDKRKSNLQVSRGGPGTPGLNDMVYQLRNEASPVDKNVIYRDRTTTVSIAATKSSMPDDDTNRILVSITHTS